MKAIGNQDMMEVGDDSLESSPLLTAEQEGKYLKVTNKNLVYDKKLAKVTLFLNFNRLSASTRRHLLFSCCKQSYTQVSK